MIQALGVSNAFSHQFSVHPQQKSPFPPLIVRKLPLVVEGQVEGWIQAKIVSLTGLLQMTDAEEDCCFLKKRGAYDRVTLLLGFAHMSILLVTRIMPPHPTTKHKTRKC